MPSDDSKKRYRLRYGLKTFLVASSLLAIFLAFIGHETYLARRQREAVEEILSAGGLVQYDGALQINDRVDKAPPGWLRRTLGDDFLRSVRGVNFINNSGTAVSAMGGMRLDRIEWLKMSSWPITNEELEKIPLARMSSLRELEMISLRFDDKTTHQVQWLTSLERLKIRNSKIGDEGMPQIGKLVNLRSLSLEESDVTDQGLASIRTLAKLERLYLENTPVAGLQFRDLALPQLRVLSLRGCPVENEVIADLSNFPRLERLNLENTRITDAAIDDLGKMKLKELWLGRTQVTPSGIKSLRSHLPQCKLHID